MTYSGDFTAGDDFAPAPAYPNIFGITFTPTISGAICAVVGLAIAAYMFMNLVQPAADQVTALQSEVDTKQAQFDQQQQNLKKVAEAQANLERAKQQKQDVLNLFATDRSLNTLLLDLNREVTKPGRVAALNSYTPSPVTPIADEFGPGVKGKLKTQTVSIGIEGTYPQIQGVIRTIERFQPLIVFRNFSLNKDQGTLKALVSPTGQLTTTGEALLRTTLILQVIVTPTDAPAPPPPAKK